MIPSIKILDLATLPSAKAETVVCLGNFDGVHLAHRALFAEAKCLRDALCPQAAIAVFCFQEPSSDYLSPAPAAHLCTPEQRLAFFRECGIERVFLGNFPSLQDLSPRDFVQNILLEECDCMGAVCGFNYRFGKHGSGNADTLKALLPVPVSVQNEIKTDGATVSSTRIRQLLAEGKAEEAATLLARPYSFSAPVVHGKSLGHKWGAPTINQFFPDKLLIPRHGVYVTDCRVEDQHFRGVSNVGSHPTVDARAAVNCETYLLNFSGNLYDKTVEISFLHFLRPEQKFNSADELIRQIQADIRAAEQYAI